jgi:nucleosome assembly protein 1-like 1
MSSNVPIKESNITAPTPQNTPLTTAPIAQGLSRPTVPDISEGVEDVLENEKDEDDEDDEEEPTEGAVKQAMMRMVQGRLAELVGKSSGYIENLPVEVKRTVEALKGVQVDYEKLQTEFKRELLQLEEKVSKVPLDPCWSLHVVGY